MTFGCGWELASRKERVARATESAPSVSGKRKGETIADVPQYRALPFLPVVVPTSTAARSAENAASRLLKKKTTKNRGCFFSDAHFRI